MKKSIFALIAIIAVATGCGDEKPGSGKSSYKVIGGDGSSFTICFAEPQTKAALATDGTLSWAKGDRFSVFRTTEGIEMYRFKGETGDTKGFITATGDGFTGITSVIGDQEEAKPLDRNCAVYPYGGDYSYDTDGELHIVYPNTQKHTPGRYTEGSAIYAAVSSSPKDVRLDFWALCGFLKISLKGNADINRIELRTNGKEKISGPADVTLFTDQEPKVRMFQDPYSSYPTQTLLFDNAETLTETPKPFYIAVPPVNFKSGMTITITDTNRYQSEITIDDAVSVSRNMVCDLGTFEFAPEYLYINGSFISGNNNLIGLITDKETGEGIAGVPVSDGYSYTVTDRNGVYQFVANELARYVYFSCPADYENPLDDATKMPAFYKVFKVDHSNFNRSDFAISKRKGSSDDWTFLSVGDPQPYANSHIDRFRTETLADIKTVLDEGLTSGKYKNPQLICLGDMASNAPGSYAYLRKQMENFSIAGGGYLPFYFLPGNHDHCKTGAKSCYESLEPYISYFGPTEYSFNVGKAHIVVMDDYYCLSYTAPYSSDYKCGVTDAQLQWLRDDLSLVEDKEDKLLFFCVHAAFYKGIESDQKFITPPYHYADLLQEMTQFHDAHILSGHTHYCLNWVHSDYKCKSGRPIYEHNENAPCGWIWSNGYICPDGSPIGYYIYEVEGNEVRDFYSKASLEPMDYKMRVYNGNQIYTSTTNYNFCWYDKSLTTATGSKDYILAELQNCFVATVWDAEDWNWKIELYINGTKYGDMKKIARGTDMCAQAFNTGTGTNLSNYSRDCQHFYYIKTPGEVDPSQVSDWEIRATQTIQSSSPVTHVYKCSSLHTDFTGFDKQYR